MRSHHIEAFGPVILATIAAQKGISLVELAGLLRSQHGASFAASTVWRFLARHALTLKKMAHAAEQKRPSAELGSRPSLTSIPSAWSSSTRPAPRPR